MREWLLSAGFALLLPGIAVTQTAAPRVLSEGNGIVLERDGSKKELTKSPQDVEPVLSPDGRLVYYTRRATGPRDERFLLPATDFLVLNFCKNEHKDDLAVRSHRYFVFGGNYDWYWLFDRSGKKELGPLGEFDDRNALIKIARDEWCH